jgi:hypothetical protein
MADPIRPPGESDGQQRLQAPDYPDPRDGDTAGSVSAASDPANRLQEPDYRHELERYSARAGSGYLQANEIQWPFGAIALVNGFFIALFRVLRFLIRSWFRWWRAEPRGAVLAKWQLARPKLAQESGQ